MDVSPEYIKQCEKATEIQGTKKMILRGDYWCWSSYPEKVYFRAEVAPLVKRNSKATRRPTAFKVWLPSQSQLQAMVDFHSFIIVKKTPWRMVVHHTLIFGESMEQLWLAFVMKKLYNKVWANGDWKEENGNI